MKRVAEFFRTRFQILNTFAKRHRLAVVGISSTLIVGLILQTVFFNDVSEAQAALTNVRQEINILDSSLSAASGNYATSSEVINIDTTKYTGATYYLEVVGTTTSATNATVSLVGASNGTAAVSVTMNGTTNDRYRSASFSPSSGDYRVRVNNEAVGKGIIAARVVIIQNTSAITSTQTQIEIGSTQTYTSGTLSGLSAPKYWKYNSSNWDGSPTFYAEVTYGRVTDATTASSTTYTTAGSYNFTVPSNSSGNTIVELWGGGGAGGAATANPGAGSGGAGGQYAKKTIAGLAGLTKTVVVAAQRAATTDSAGQAGNDSTWDSNVVVAKGGAGGAADAGTAGAGSVTNGVGDTVYAGGNGAAGVAAGSSGGGGEGARSTGTGGSASGATGGTGGDGGDGGTGSATKTDGAPGSAPGGGGAGGKTTNGGNNQGGAGAAGKAIITYNVGVSATTTIKLQESDGTGDGFTGWSDKITIVSGGSASTPTRVRSSSFTPTAGRNYRIAVQEGYNGATHAIYSAKIIVDQTSSPTKLEPQYLLANKTLASGTALQKYFTYFDTAEWTNAINTYTHQVDAANGSASVVEVATEGGTQVTGSVVTSPDNSGVSSSMTMPSTGDLDMRATTNNGDVYASRILVAVTPDVTAPTPNPYFSTLPTSTSTDRVSMTSVAITDANAVQYYFNPVAGSCGGNAGTGTTTSGWQSSRTYYDTGLQVNKCYAYTVTGKDGAGNTTATSTASTTYTLAATPGGTAYYDVGVDTLSLYVVDTNNPSINPTTYYAIRASSTDSTWNNKWVNIPFSGPENSTSPVWGSEAQFSDVPLTNLQPNTRYDFEVVARNQNQVLTATSTLTGTTTLADTSAPSPAPSFLSGPDNNGTTQIDMTSTVPTTENTPPIQYQFAYNPTGCAANNGGDGATRTWSTSDNYQNSGLSINKCYSYTVQARDSVSPTPNATAVSSEVDVYTGANTPSAPTLSNAGETTFEIDNNANSNPSNTEFAAMVTSSDGDWNNQYIKSDGTSSATPVWLSDAVLDAVTVTGLDFSTSYTVKVMARNGDNENTASSTTSNISTNADGTAPTPNPYFSSAPSNDSSSQISMTSVAVTDPTTPVNYYFTAVTGSCGAHLGTGGTNSNWQAGASYSDSGLQINRCYAYTVTAKDASNNRTATSTASSTYTSAAVPGLVTSSAVTDTTITIQLDENSNPTGAGGAPNTDFAVFVTSSDTDWNNKYVDSAGNPQAAAQWLTSSQIDSLVVQGLDFATTYTFSAKARNEDNDETSFGSTNDISTSEEIIPETRLQGGVRLQGLRIW